MLAVAAFLFGAGPVLLLVGMLGRADRRRMTPAEIGAQIERDRHRSWWTGRDAIVFRQSVTYTTELLVGGVTCLAVALVLVLVA